MSQQMTDLDVKRIADIRERIGCTDHITAVTDDLSKSIAWLHGEDERHVATIGFAIFVSGDFEPFYTAFESGLRGFHPANNGSPVERSRPADAGDQNPPAAIGPTSDGGAATLEQEGDA